MTPSSSAPFIATKQLKPLHSTMAERFDATTKSEFEICREESGSSNDFEVPHYPIEEKQNRLHMLREMSVK